MQLSASIQKLNLIQLFTSGTPQKYESAQIDFSNSLLDGLEELSSSIGGETYSKRNEVIFI